MTTNKILIIEDDDIVSRTIKRSLRSEDYHVTTASSGVEGLKIARANLPDMVILDVIMPGMDGYTVCREMRSDIILSEVPILFLTAKIKDEDKIEGFNAGADDYLCKPFNIDELILRVRAIIRRTMKQSELVKEPQDTQSNIHPRVQAIIEQINHEPKHLESVNYLIVDDFVLDTRTYELYTPERGKMRLTPVQYDLLYHLMSHPGQIFSPNRLLDEVWDYPADTGSPDLVRVHVKNLRERIEANPSEPMFLRTVSGFGYTVDPSNE